MHINKLLLFCTIGFLLHCNNLRACDCIEVTKTSIDNLLSVSEYVFTGTVLRSNHWDKIRQEYNQSKSLGSDVLIVVDSVINGRLNVGDTVYLHQFFSSGNCTAIFDFGSQQLIFGRRLKSVSQIISEDQISYETGQESNEKDYKLISKEYYQEITDFLKLQLEKYVTVETSMCASFYLDTAEFDNVSTLLKK